MTIFRFLTVDPVSLSGKAKLQAMAACFIAILLVAALTAQISTGVDSPIIIASMGASAVILFLIPNSPLAQPWPFFGGQICSALVGVSCAQYIGDKAFAAALAVGGAVLVMLILRCLHPPGAATSMAPVMAGDPLTSLGYDFVFFPVLINVMLMLFVSIVINRWCLKRSYPSPLPKQEIVHQRHTFSEPSHRIGLSEQDVATALHEMDVFIDLTPDDLSKLLTRAEMNTFKRIRGDLCCADIMISKVVTADFGTEVEDAWKIMYSQNLKVMPVIDQARRVIGIITWHDFFKYLNLTAYENFQDQFRNFIRRTPNVTSIKPESVGQIMTTSIVALPDYAHIVELIPLMSAKGHRQIPIVDSEQRLVGMVYQANLIAALYNSTLACTINKGGGNAESS